MEEYNPQSQPKLSWPAEFPVARAYLDQLIRNEGLSAARTTAIAAAIDAAERVSGELRSDRLVHLARQLEAEAAGSGDPVRVLAMAAVVREMAVGPTR
jgi:hypothetical protein